MQDPTITEAHPGVKRLRYFLLTFALGFVYGLTAVVAGPESTATSVTTLVMLVGCLVLNVARLRNIGASQWWALLSFVPILNMLFGILVLAAQPGWIETRRFDYAGKVILSVYAAFFVLIFGTLLMVYMSFAGSDLRF